MKDDHPLLAPFTIDTPSGVRLKLAESFGSVVVSDTNGSTYLSRAEVVTIVGWLTAFLDETR